MRVMVWSPARLKHLMLDRRVRVASLTRCAGPVIRKLAWALANSYF
jgi:hypothetical protein